MAGGGHPSIQLADDVFKIRERQILAGLDPAIVRDLRAPFQVIELKERVSRMLPLVSGISMLLFPESRQALRASNCRGEISCSQTMSSCALLVLNISVRKNTWEGCTTKS